MHHFALIVSSLSLTMCLFNKRSIHQSTRIYNTRANVKKKMEGLEQENQVLRAEVASMKTKMEELTSMKTEMEKLNQLVKLMAVTQQPPPPPLPVST